MGAAGRRQWRVVTAALARLELLSAADHPALVAFCAAVDRHEEACKMLAESGLLVRDRDGSVRKSPLLQVARDSAMLVRAFAGELGCSPLARQALHGVVNDDPMDPEILALLA